MKTEKDLVVKEDQTQVTEEREKRVKFEKTNPNNISIDGKENEGMDDTRMDGLRNEASHYNIFEKFEEETHSENNGEKNHEINSGLRFFVFIKNEQEQNLDEEIGNALIQHHRVARNIIYLHKHKCPRNISGSAI